MAPEFEIADGNGAEVLGALVTEDGLDDAGFDRDVLARLGFKGKRGTSALVPDPDGRLRAVAGLGPADEVDARAVRKAAAALGRASRRASSLAVSRPDGTGLDDGVVTRVVAEGIGLAGYSFGRYKSDPEPSKLERVVLEPPADQADVDRAARVVEAVALARDLVNEPGGALTPSVLADLAVEMAEREGLEAVVLDRAAITEAGMGGLLGVNRGSEQEPRFIELRHEPDDARGRVALVGKGITFDSGGLSIKPADAMVGMKGDLGGAAAVLGAMSAVRAVAPDVAVRAYVPSTDNMLGPDATRPGDVLTIRDGSTVEVLNTDAEGRLILADALSLAAEAEPDAVVDLATLTGACVVGLGSLVAGLMGNHDGWLDQVRAAADRAGEPVWPLPLPREYRKLLDSDVADIKNVGPRYGGAITAGLFLQHFVPDGLPWAHLDIAGPAYAEEADAEWDKGGTGFGVRTLLELLEGFRPPNSTQ
ncbi:MAG TPA: leucyl aminopeptidase [Acidimicrobiales bacterium]|nr:leucyl aminopeptidase [Acidimicrobiales bacterium]